SRRAPGGLHQRRFSRTGHCRCQGRRMRPRLALCAFSLAAILPAQNVLRLSMKRAVDLATSPEGNVNIQIAAEAVKQAQARSAQARAALLPGLDMAAS